MNRVSELWSCPMGRADNLDKGVVLSTNWEYLNTMKMNPMAPAANLGPVTRPEEREDGKAFAPWFWPDGELSDAVNIRQAAYINNPDQVLQTADDDPIVRAASQQLLWHQANYLAEHFPENYVIQRSRKYGRVIINKTDLLKVDAFSIRPEGNDLHPLAISGLLGQEDICIVQETDDGRHVLVAGFLATPTHWNLSNFMNADMDKIHKHVKGYHKPVQENGKPRLKDTVDKYLTSLREYPEKLAWRNNQFIEYDPQLALDRDYRSPIDARKAGKDVGDRIFLRSERETLTRLPAPYEDFIIFTIKPHVYRMSDVRRLRGADFARSVATNAVIRSSLTSGRNVASKDKFDFRELLSNYLTVD